MAGKRGLMLAVSVAAVLALAGAAGAQDSAANVVAVPSNTAWARGVVLGIMWLFIGGILLGPIVVFFQLLPEETGRNDE